MTAVVQDDCVHLVLATPPGRITLGGPLQAAALARLLDEGAARPLWQLCLVTLPGLAAALGRVVDSWPARGRLIDELYECADELTAARGRAWAASGEDGGPC